MKKFLILICLFMISLSLFAVEADITVRGSVEKIDGSFITVIIDNKKEVFKLAPKWYLMENGYMVKEGETVNIRYRKVNNVNSVTEVVKNKRVYKFTDKKGEFLWKRGGIGGKEEDATAKVWNVSDSTSGVVSTGGGQIGPNSGPLNISTGGQTGPQYIKPIDGGKVNDFGREGGKVNDFGKDGGGRERRDIGELQGRER